MPTRRKLEFNDRFLLSAVMNILVLQFLFSWLKFRIIATNKGSLRQKSWGRGEGSTHWSQNALLSFILLDSPCLTLWSKCASSFTYEEHEPDTQI